MQTFCKSIGIRILEGTEVIERGEVEIQVDTAVGAAQKSGKVTQSGLEKTDTLTLCITEMKIVNDLGIKMIGPLTKENVTASDVID